MTSTSPKVPPSTQGMLSCACLELFRRGSAPGDSAYSLPAHQGLNPTSPFRKSNLQAQTPLSSPEDTRSFP